MAAFRIVVGFDVLKDIGFGRFPGRVTCSLYLLHLQGMEEAFHGRVVVTVALPAHAAQQAMVLKQRLVIQGRVLAAPIGMQDQPGWGTAPEQGHGQGRHHQLLGDPFRHGPADHGSGIEVQHDRQIQPTFACPQVGDVGHPLLVGTRGGEVLLQPVGCHRQAMLRVRGRLEAPRRSRPKPQGPHPFSHPPSADTPTLGLQIQRDAGRAVTPPVIIKESLNVSVQTPVFGCSGRLRRLPPGVIATPTHPEHPTQSRHRKHPVMSLDEGVPYRDSLAKYAAAFFRIATSSSRWANRRLSRETSAACSACMASAPWRSR